MTCPGCEDFEVAAPGSLCDRCGRILRQADVDRYHASLIPPRREIEEEKFDYALREA